MTDLSPTSVIALRQAVKNVFYTTVNSSAYESYVPSQLPAWMTTMFVIDGILVLLLAALEYFALRRNKKEVH